jgi:hypothetical protein
VHPEVGNSFKGKKLATGLDNRLRSLVSEDRLTQKGQRGQGWRFMIQ